MTVPGDLVVAKNISCALADVTIEGEVRVPSGGDLLVTDTSMAERVVVQADGYFDGTGAEIGGNVVSQGGYGVYLDASTVGGQLCGPGG